MHRDDDWEAERAQFLAELARREQGLDLPPRDWQVAVPRRAPSRTPWLIVLVIAAAVFVGILTPGNQTRQAMEAIGLREPHRGPDTNAVGPHVFLALQRDGRTPVGWNPCEPVPYVVNPARAPRDWEGLVHDSVAEIANATGLDFVYEGTTDERPFAEQYYPQPGPVVIGWGDDAEFPGLAGKIAGLGGSTPQSGRGGDYYVNGGIALDVDFFGDSSIPRSSHRALLIHELGHVVGLDHVEDRRQLMHHEGSAYRLRLAEGDRQGLAALGNIPCR